MPVEWRVTYSIEPNIEITPADPAIPAFNLELHYSPEGKLKGAIHTVQTKDADRPEIAYSTSQKELLVLWEALRYTSGIPLQVRASGAETTGHIARRMTAAAGAFHVRSASKVPDPARLQSSPDRLTTWLWLANAARAATEDAEALRNYYMILEDIHGRPDNSRPTLQRIALARDFVSHAKIDRRSGRAFLEAELGYSAPEYQYDAHLEAHRKLARKYREEARQAVERELQPYV
jgi:hypothetical protein